MGTVPARYSLVINTLHHRPTGANFRISPHTRARRKKNPLYGRGTIVVGVMP